MARGRQAGLVVLIALGIAACASAVTYLLPSPAWLEGLLFDSAVAVSASSRDDAPPQVAVIGIDARSLDAPELAGFPRAMFGKVWAKTINDLKFAGAKVITFDLIFSFYGNQLVTGFDASFMRALHGARERIVVARSSRTLPVRNYLGALRAHEDASAIGMVETYPDGDDVYRRLKMRFTVPGEEPLPALGAAALRRAGVRDIPETVVLAPTRHPEALPTYSLIDVLRCSLTEPRDLQRLFADKLVFIGTILPEEDRKTSSARFLSPPVQPGGPKTSCGVQHLAASVPGAGNVPGVHLHALAAQSVLSGRIVEPPDRTVSAILAGAAALAGAAIAFALTPVFAVLAVVAGGVLLWGAQAWMLVSDYWLAAANAILFLVIAAVIAYLVRFFVVERRHRRIHSAFGHYLAPALVDRLAEGRSELELGGEARDVTIMFADLSGFTALSEKVSPEQLVEETNEYLKLIADVVDESGGYIDKFIGDAVMAIWNAPADDDDHAANAVAAALEIGKRISAARSEAQARGEHGFDVKIGVNSGPAVVGNVGSEKRYNYTAVGEAVNIAARLESLPGEYNCLVVIGEETADRIKDRYHLREIDAVEVKGKSEPLRIYEPVAEERPYFPLYADALKLYRNREFGAAAGKWAGLTDRDGPSAIMAARARAYAQNPPPKDWDGVFVMATK